MSRVSPLKIKIADISAKREAISKGSQIFFLQIYSSIDNIFDVDVGNGKPYAIWGSIQSGRFEFEILFLP